MAKNELSEKEIKEIRWRVDAVINAVFQADDTFRQFDLQFALSLPKGAYGIFGGGRVQLLMAMDFALELATLLGFDQEPHIAARVAQRRADQARAEGQRDRFMRDGLL